MIASEPSTIDGQTFDRYSLNLAITGTYRPGGQPDANVAMRLVPTAIRDGEVITADEAAKGIVLGTLSGADVATQQAVGAIQQALQAYLAAKGF